MALIYNNYHIKVKSFFAHSPKLKYFLTQSNPCIILQDMVIRKATDAPTHEDFSRFKDVCKRWVRFLNITDRRISYQHVGIPFFSVCKYEPKNQEAAIGLSKDDWHGYERDDLDETAFHEVMEFLLSGLAELATRRHDVSEEDIEIERHRIINILTGSIYERLRNEI